MDETGRTAVITGGAGGIGRAVAERLASEGFRLVLADLDETVLDETVAQLAAGGAEVAGVGCDVAVASDLEAVRDAALARFGRVDVVLSNAGVGGGSALGSPPEVYSWVLDVNLGGVVNGVAAFLPLLLEQGSGHLINTASVAGLGGVPGMGPYSAAKAAVIALSESLLHELGALGTEVRCSVLCPGFVRTRIHDSLRSSPASVARWAAEADARRSVELVRQAVESGIDASLVADAVAAALVDGRFWILTHPRVAIGMARQRSAWMESGEPPSFDLRRAGEPG
jgi:NAD(P)-dependent dehydrogenase (short-subunit alcohol dehydrogenase family)